MTNIPRKFTTMPLCVGSTIDAIVTTAEQMLPLHGRKIGIDLDPQVPRYLFVDELRFWHFVLEMLADAVAREVIGEIRVATSCVGEGEGMAISVIVVQDRVLPTPRRDRHVFKSFIIRFLQREHIAFPKEPWPDAVLG